MPRSVHRGWISRERQVEDLGIIEIAGLGVSV